MDVEMLGTENRGIISILFEHHSRFWFNGKIRKHLNLLVFTLSQLFLRFQVEKAYGSEGRKIGASNQYDSSG